MLPLLLAVLWLPAATWSAVAAAAVAEPQPQKNYAARLAESHVSHMGARYPTPEFADALAAAAMDVSGLAGSSEGRSLVILGMANHLALELTVPLFLESLSRIKGEPDAARTLDSHLVLVVWEAKDVSVCSELQRTYRHLCVRDAEHRRVSGQFGFHTAGFNSLGFAKVMRVPYSAGSRSAQCIQGCMLASVHAGSVAERAATAYHGLGQHSPAQGVWHEPGLPGRGAARIPRLGSAC